MVQPTANTELTIAFIRIMESIMCLLCLIAHINGLNEEEPIPHIVLFCGTFGGFFILSLAKLVVPLSGQLSPPGVDLVFSFLGFILFYAAACAAMFYVQRDPHLIVVDGQRASVEEATHPFFQRCVMHAILSISTGTLFLMHAVISADRLTSILKGIEEDIEREIDENDIDIFPDDTISLHLFFINWLILIWNTACCRSIRKCARRCQLRCIQYYRKKRPPSYIPRRRLHRRAQMLMTTELTRINGITVSNIAPEEFIRNPRRSLAQKSVLAFVENENTANKSMSVTSQQGPSSQPHSGPKKKPKTVVWNVKKNSYNFESGEGNIISPDENQTIRSTSSVESFESFHSSEIPFDKSFSRNKEFGSDEDLPNRVKKQKIPNTEKKKVGVSFIRNEAFENDEDDSKLSKLKNILKKSPKTADKAESDEEFVPKTLPQRSMSFVRNKAFGSDTGSVMIQTKRPLLREQGSNEKQISFTRNKEFGSEAESKLKKFFKWIPRKAESVVQNVDEDTIRSMETFSPKFTRDLRSTDILQVVDGQKSSEEEIFSFELGDKSIDTSNIEKKASPTELQILTIKNREAPESTIFEFNDDASISNSNVSPDTEFILCKKLSKTSLQTQDLENEDISSPNMVAESLSNINAKTSSEPVSPNIPMPKIVISNKEPTMAVSESIEESSQFPNLPTANVIPYILTSTVNKELEIVLDEILKKKQKRDSISSIKNVTGLIPSNNSESTLQTQTTDDKYRYAFPDLDSTSYMKEVASLIPSINISYESASKNKTEESDEIDYHSTSFTKEDPSNRISESTSISETDETDYGSTSYMKKNPSNRISESTSISETDETEFDSTSYMKEVESLTPSEIISESTSTNQTSQDDYRLIPSNRNVENLTSSRKEEKKKKSTDYIKQRK